MPTLYHPKLDRVMDFPDDESAAVMRESGWGDVVPAEHTDAALAPVQPGATYQLVNPPRDDADSNDTDTDADTSTAKRTRKTT